MPAADVKLMLARGSRAASTRSRVSTARSPTFPPTPPLDIGSYLHQIASELIATLSQPDTVGPAFRL